MMWINLQPHMIRMLLSFCYHQPAWCDSVPVDKRVSVLQRSPRRPWCCAGQWSRFHILCHNLCRRRQILNYWASEGQGFLKPQQTTRSCRATAGDHLHLQRALEHGASVFGTNTNDWRSETV